jgi:hypothetical protein
MRLAPPPYGAENSWRQEPAQLSGWLSFMNVDSATRGFLEGQRLLRTNQASGKDAHHRLVSNSGDSNIRGGVAQLPLRVFHVPIQTEGRRFDHAAVEKDRRRAPPPYRATRGRCPKG